MISFSNVYCALIFLCFINCEQLLTPPSRPVACSQRSKQLANQTTQTSINGTNSSVALVNILSRRAGNVSVTAQPIVGNVTAPIGKISEKQITDVYIKPFGNWERPRLDSNDPVTVYLSFEFYGIIDVYDNGGIVRVSGCLRMHWIDELRRWSEEFPQSCIDFLALPANAVWIPDVVQINSDSRHTVTSHSGEKVRLYSNGLSTFRQSGIFATFCEFDWTLYPFDEQTCALTFESASYMRRHLTFQLSNNATISKYFVDNEEWEFLDIFQQIDNFSSTELDILNSRDHLRIYISMKRKSEYYLINVVLPIAFIAVAHLAAFFLPVGDSNRVQVSFISLLTCSVFCVSIVNQLPRAMDSLPLMLIYIYLQMAYIILSMLGQGVCLIAMSRIDNYGFSTPVIPSCIYDLICMVALMFCVGHEPPRITDVVKIDRQLRRNPFRQSMTTLPQVLVSSPNQELPFAGSVNTSQEIGKDQQSATDADIADAVGDLTNTKVQAPQFSRRSRESEERFHQLDFRQLQWQFFAHVIDRIIVVLYVIAIIITPIALFIIHPAKSSATALVICGPPCILPENKFNDK